MHLNHRLFIYLNPLRHTLTISSQLIRELGTPTHLSVAIDRESGIITLRAASKKIFNRNLCKLTQMGEGEQWRISGTKLQHAGFPARERVYVELQHDLSKIFTERVFKARVDSIKKGSDK